MALVDPHVTPYFLRRLVNSWSLVAGHQAIPPPRWRCRLRHWWKPTHRTVNTRIWSVPSPLLLPPPENSPRPDVDPYLSPPQEDFSSASNASSPTNQATIDSASHTRGAEDIGWEQYFSHKIKYKGEGISLKSLFLVSGCPTQSSNISSVGLVTHERRTNNVHIRYRFPIPSISNCGKSMVWMKRRGREAMKTVIISMIERTNDYVGFWYKVNCMLFSFMFES